jgi:hypothetical protein
VVKLLQADRLRINSCSLFKRNEEQEIENFDEIKCKYIFEFIYNFEIGR